MIHALLVSCFLVSLTMTMTSTMAIDSHARFAATDRKSRSTLSSSSSIQKTPESPKTNELPNASIVQKTSDSPEMIELPNSSIVQNRSDFLETSELSRSNLVQNRSDFLEEHQSEFHSPTAAVFSRIKPTELSSDEKSQPLTTPPTPGQQTNDSQSKAGQQTNDSQPKAGQHLHLDAHALAKCFNDDQESPDSFGVFNPTYVLYGQGTITMVVHPGDPILSQVHLPICYIRVEVPLDYNVLVDVQESPHAVFSADMNVVNVSNICEFNYPLSETVSGHPPLVFVSTGSSLIISLFFPLLESVPGVDTVRLGLNFSAFRYSGLQLINTSPSAGFVQTPLYDGERVLAGILQQQSAEIAVPPDHQVMVSFPWAEVRVCLSLTVWTHDSPPQSFLAWSLCCIKPPSPALYNASRLTVRMEVDHSCVDPSDEVNLDAVQTTDPQGVQLCTHGSHSFKAMQLRHTGFRMMVSVHNRSSTPERLLDGRHRLLCNCRKYVPLKQSCQYLKGQTSICLVYGGPGSSGSDSGHCPRGYFKAGDACLIVEWTEDEEGDWRAASDRCVLRGDTLAVLNTEQRHHDVIRFLKPERWRLVFFFIGLTVVPLTLPLWYRNILQWTDGTMAFHRFSSNPAFSLTRRNETMTLCAYLGRTVEPQLRSCYYKRKQWAAVCQKPVKRQPTPPHHFPTSSSQWSRERHVTCPLQHVTHDFLACDALSDCFPHGACPALMTPPPPTFTCSNLVESVPFTLVCDHRSDCADGSDEKFCVSPGCSVEEFSCGYSPQCLPVAKECDGWQDCVKGEDEMRCDSEKPSNTGLTYLAPPALLDVGSAEGRFVYSPLNSPGPTTGSTTGSPGGRFVYSNLTSTSTGSSTRSACPETHFQCQDTGYCLPVFLRCNDVYDCADLEDEAGCDQYTCPGFYRCRGSTVCVHQSHLCDGHPHCPQHDDELMCDFTCPITCVCRGLAFFCHGRFNATAHRGLRYLNAEGSNMTFTDLKDNFFLVYLSLARCGLTDTDKVDHHFPNLLTLDVSDNFLSSVDSAFLESFPHLQALSLAGNPLSAGVFSDVSGQFPQVLVLNLSHVHIPLLNVSRLSIFTKLHVLNLSDSGVDKVVGEGFNELTQLGVLDLRGCPVTQFPGQMFQGLGNLQAVYAQSFRLCCPVLLPAAFNPRKCSAPADEVSSCDDLLGSTVYSVCVFVFALAALVGNATTFIYRTFVNRSRSKLGFSVFVTHLSVSDFLMGVYLAIIGTADSVYRDTYLWNDVNWRHSAACSLAGFLSLLSSEASALMMCLITADRFLVLCFPFSRLHFGVRSAKLASLLVWLLCLGLASVPLMPGTSHWHFYSQTGICIPLPVTRTEFPGRVYSFSIVIVFNFILFVFISLGQLLIYWSVRANTMSAANTNKKSKDLSIARRLIVVAMSDFLCWFPIGLLGLLASRGVPIPGQVNVGMAVFVLPLNSALNPFLYTVNVILERRRLAREDELRKFITAQLRGKT